MLIVFQTLLLQFLGLRIGCQLDVECEVLCQVFSDLFLHGLFAGTLLQHGLMVQLIFGFIFFLLCQMLFTFNNVQFLSNITPILLLLLFDTQNPGLLLHLPEMLHLLFQTARSVKLVVPFLELSVFGIVFVVKAGYR